MQTDVFRTVATKAAVGVVLLCSAAPVLGSDKPNVIVIMADDLGAEGLGCYGSTIYTTPNLDRMAEEGVRFDNAYATPLCTPTRVMIMSGLYANRTGFRALIGKGKGVRMPAEIKTFGHIFREAGYQTGIAGKWQLGKFDEHPGQPVEHGFDEYCMWTWFYGGKKSSRFYSPQIYQAGKVINGAESDFGPDYFNDFVLDFIDRNKDRPFFFYYPMVLVHSPFIHPPKLEALARSKYTDDLDKKTVAFGHMITYMDHIVGNILTRLRKHGIEKNTLVLFTADNGTHKSITSKLPGMSLKGGKGSMTEAGTRVPFIAWWPETIQPGVRNEFLCLVDVLPTIASVAGIELDWKFDGMDLSHNLIGTEGPDRERILMSYKQGFFARDKRFRLHEDGTLHDIPVTSDKERYSEKTCTTPERDPQQKLLQGALDELMAIPQEYGQTATAGPERESPKTGKPRKKRGKREKI